MPWCSFDEYKRHLGGVDKATFLKTIAYLVEDPYTVYHEPTREEKAQRAANSVATFAKLDVIQVVSSLVRLLA